MIYQTTIPKEEISRCLLCDNAVCSKACPDRLDPAGILRSIRFENLQGAAAWLNGTNKCA